MYRLGPYIPMGGGGGGGGGGLIKTAKRMCICECVKNRIGIFKIYVKKKKKGISELLS